MRLFIADRVGSGDRNDPFRPTVTAAQVGGRLGTYVLPDGRFLCVAPKATRAPAGTVDFGSDPHARLGNDKGLMSDADWERGQIAEAFGYRAAQFVGLTPGEMVLSGDGKITGSRRRRDGTGGRVKVKVAGVELYDAPAISGGATDTFTYTDGALPTVSGGAWETLDANAFNVASNAVSVPTFAFGCSRYATAFAGDHYTQFEGVQSAAELAVCLRASASVNSYFYGFVSDSPNAELHRCTTGSFTLLDSQAGVATSGTRVYRGESEGSVQSVLVDAVEILSATDATFNANPRVGFGGYTEGAATIDNWEGGALAAPVMTQTCRRRPALTYRGGR